MNQNNQTPPKRRLRSLSTLASTPDQKLVTFNRSMSADSADSVKETMRVTPLPSLIGDVDNAGPPVIPSTSFRTLTQVVSSPSECDATTQTAPSVLKPLPIRPPTTKLNWKWMNQVIFPLGFLGIAALFVGVIWGTAIINCAEKQAALFKNFF